MVSGDGSDVFWSLVTCFWDLVLGNMSSGVLFHVVCFFDIPVPSAWCLVFVCPIQCFRMSVNMFSSSTAHELIRQRRLCQRPSHSSGPSRNVARPKADTTCQSVSPRVCVAHAPPMRCMCAVTASDSRMSDGVRLRNV